MPAPLVECVPNFSEGRDPVTLDALRAAITSVLGVRLLDVQADPSHNRSVFTLVAHPDAAAEAAFRGMRVATERIDLTQHTGEHPRMGATDVVPFVPVRDVTMDDCVALARRLAERAATELAIPIYLYARAATRPDRERLPDIRKGDFEGLRDRIGKDPAADPNFGRRATGCPGLRVRGGREGSGVHESARYRHDVPRHGVRRRRVQGARARRRHTEKRGGRAHSRAGDSERRGHLPEVAGRS